MKTFRDKSLSLYNEIEKYLKSVLKKRGNEYQLINPQDIEDEYPDEFYELPRVWTLTDGGYHDEFAVVAIDLIDDKIVFQCIHIDEYDDENIDMEDIGSEIYNLALIADKVRELEK